MAQLGFDFKQPLWILSFSFFTDGLFFVYFHLFVQNFFSSLQDLSLDRRSRRWGRWPLDLHHGPRILSFSKISFTVILLRLVGSNPGRLCCFIHYSMASQPAASNWFNFEWRKEERAHPWEEKKQISRCTLHRSKTFFQFRKKHKSDSVFNFSILAKKRDLNRRIWTSQVFAQFFIGLSEDMRLHRPQVEELVSDFMLNGFNHSEIHLRTHFRPLNEVFLSNEGSN